MIAHIGLPKAGSTTLQRHLFPHLSGINYIGRSPGTNVGNDLIGVKDQPKNPQHELFHEQLVVASSFDKNLASEILDNIKSNFKSDRPTLYSSEFLTSVFFSHPNIQEKLERLKLLGFNRVILILRKQSELIKSQYRDHPFEPSDLIHGKPVTIEEWIIKAHELKHSFIDLLKYDQLILILNKLFGEQNVHIDIIEELAMNQNKFLNRLTSFLGVSSYEQISYKLPSDNTGVSKRYNEIRRFKKKIIGELPISKILPTKFQEVLRKQLKKGTKESITINESSSQFLRSHYLDGNIELINSGYDSMQVHGYDRI